MYSCRGWPRNEPYSRPQGTMSPLDLPAHGSRRSWRTASSWETTRPSCRSRSAASSSSTSSAVKGSSSKAASRRAQSTESAASRRRYSTNRGAAWTSGSGRASTRECSRSFSVIPIVYIRPSRGFRVPAGVSPHGGRRWRWCLRVRSAGRRRGRRGRVGPSPSASCGSAAPPVNSNTG